MLGILVQLKIVLLPSSVFAWCVTVVLPINSAINPYLYTIASLISNQIRKDKPSNQQMQQNQDGGVPGNSETVETKLYIESSLFECDGQLTQNQDKLENTEI